MKKKFDSGSAFFSSRALLAVLCTAAACSMLTLPLLAVLRSEGTSHQRTLTFDERVSYQRAIEEVYWRHRIWPSERKDPKPSLDAVMSQAQLEAKVAGYLRKSQALEDYWQRTITAEQLQAEMDRMAVHTKQPEVLRELVDALENDPLVIAECLARPAFAERLLTNSYAYDQRIHGELKERAKAELQAHGTVEQMKQTNGDYSEIEFVRSESAHGKENHENVKSVRRNGREWEEAVQKVAETFNIGGSRPDASTHVGGYNNSAEAKNAGARAYQAIPIGKLSSLQEDETRYYTVAVVGKANDQLKLATVSWLKEPLDSWLAKAETQVPVTMAAVSANYTLPVISGYSDNSIPSGGCTDDTWTLTSPTNVPDARVNHTAVWTGSEMIVWGGYNGSYLNSGGRYNPSTDSWTATSNAGAPDARSRHTAVWTGSEMIVWGGQDANLVHLNTGGRYNPSTNSWIATSTTNTPDGREDHTAVWTRSEMILWGGFGVSGQLNSGGRYNPSTDSWTATSITNAPIGREAHTAIWTGGEMIVWGGFRPFVELNTGGRYDPSTDTWTATSLTNVPTARDSHTAVWTGTEMIIWGAAADASGGRYNPSSDSWIATSITDAPDSRIQHAAVWTGSEMIVWGGLNFPAGFLNTGGRYNPSTDSWTATSTANAPTGRYFHTAVWTGSEMIIWGGLNGFGGNLNTGGRYNPSIDSWTTTSISGAPVAREFHTAVWTGSDMIIWGGEGQGGELNTDWPYNPKSPSGPTPTPTPVPFLNTGARYNPDTDSWTATSTANAPAGRYIHTAVWTGTEMIIWGGYDSVTGITNTGGRYDPSTDSWTATSITNAPAGRSLHTAVWSGGEMIVWGGGACVLGCSLNTGGRYHPSTDSWIAASTTNAPAARFEHTAVWTGGEMIVWGGRDGFAYYDTGGRYNPSIDSWTATSTTNAPSARSTHATVWTGSEMIVWGGSDANSFPITGGRYCAQSASLSPTPTPTATPRVTPRPRPSPHRRP